MFFQNNKPRDKGCYAVNTGLYIGEFFVYMKDNGLYYEFLSLPKMIVRAVPKKSFLTGVKNDIITYVAKLPKDIFSVCQAQYNKSKTSTTTFIAPLSG